MREYSILRDKFAEGVTIDQAARVAGLKVRHRYWSESDRRAQILRAVYQNETGRDPDKRFDTGLGRMQWEYGVRGTDYWRKDKRAAVLAYMGASA